MYIVSIFGCPDEDCKIHAYKPWNYRCKYVEFCPTVEQLQRVIWKWMVKHRPELEKVNPLPTEIIDDIIKTGGIKQHDNLLIECGSFLLVNEGTSLTFNESEIKHDAIYNMKDLQAIL